MSGDDWKPGDLALCVHVPVGTNQCAGLTAPVRRGGIYGVEAVLRDEYGNLGLRLVGIVFPGSLLNAALARNFRKINPLTDEERDEFKAELDALVRETRHA